MSTPATLGEVVLEGASPLLPPGHKYLSLVGSLLWVSLTRPDVHVIVAISRVCARSARPTKADLASALRILRYLLHTPDIKFTFARSPSPTTLVAVFVDQDGRMHETKSRSQYDYMVCIGGMPVM